MQPDMENIKQKIKENRDLLDRITAKLPGFSGYVEKTEMYEANKIIRNFMVDRLQSYKNEVNSISKEYFDSGKSDLLKDLESLGTSLERVLKKCEQADFGTSGSHAGVKVTEEDQNRLLEYDWRLITTLDELEGGLNQIRTAEGEKAKGQIKTFLDQLRTFEKSFDDRKNVILEVI